MSANLCKGPRVYHTDIQKSGVVTGTSEFPYAIRVCFDDADHDTHCAISELEDASHCGAGLLEQACPHCGEKFVEFHLCRDTQEEMGQ
jgi:hypothetical protein